MIEYWIDIPNLQTVNLPVSFEWVRSKSITSICMNMDEWIDVSPILADLIKARYGVSKTMNDHSNTNNAHSTTTRNQKSCIIVYYSCWTAVNR